MNFACPFSLPSMRATSRFRGGCAVNDALREIVRHVLEDRVIHFRHGLQRERH